MFIHSAAARGEASVPASPSSIGHVKNRNLSASIQWDSYPATRSASDADAADRGDISFDKKTSSGLGGEYFPLSTAANWVCKGLPV